MKKILILHNSYRSFGGEDVSVANELELLNQNFEVKYIEVSNKKVNLIDLISIALFNSNLRFIFKIKNQIINFRPDVVYIHNTWFLITPNIIKYILKKETKVVLKLHNFRYYCSSSISINNHTSKNSFCKACGLRNKKYSIINKYFYESYLKSYFLWRQSRKLLKIIKYNKNLKLFVLTSFHKNFIIENFQLSEKRIYTVPNYLKINKQIESSFKRKDITYAGRISIEKGVENLIKAFNLIKFENTKLNIIGDGPELNKLKNLYSNSNINFLGELENSKTLDIISKSYLVATGTMLFEGQPTLLCEAVFLKVPILFPLSGGISEFFGQENILSYSVDKEDKYIIKEIATKFKFAFENNLDDLILKNFDYLNQIINKEKIIKQFDNIVNE